MAAKSRHQFLACLVAVWLGASASAQVLSIDNQENLTDLEIQTLIANSADVAIGRLAFTGLGGLNSLRIEKLEFYGLAGNNDVSVGSLSFTGLNNQNNVEIEALAFTGLGGKKFVEIGSLNFTGFGVLAPVLVNDEIVFEGWRSELAGQTTQEISFEGWGGDDGAVSVASLMFRGVGPGLSYSCNGVPKHSNFSKMPSSQPDGAVFAVLNCAVTWRSAEQLCQKLDGHLATLATEAEAAFVAGLVSKCSGNGCWIGASDTGVEGNFNWVTGEDWMWENWAAGEPNDYQCGEDFGYIRRDGKWNDYPSGEIFDQVDEEGCGEYGPPVLLELICEF